MPREARNHVPATATFLWFSLDFFLFSLIRFIPSLHVFLFFIFLVGHLTPTFRDGNYCHDKTPARPGLQRKVTRMKLFRLCKVFETGAQPPLLLIFRGRMPSGAIISFSLPPACNFYDFLLQAKLGTAAVRSISRPIQQLATFAT